MAAWYARRAHRLRDEFENFAAAKFELGVANSKCTQKTRIPLRKLNQIGMLRARA
jgi:hypothetical protein